MEDTSGDVGDRLERRQINLTNHGLTPAIAVKPPIWTDKRSPFARADGEWIDGDIAASQRRADALRVKADLFAVRE
jgi:hypothetical protein